MTKITDRKKEQINIKCYVCGALFQIDSPSVPTAREWLALFFHCAKPSPIICPGCGENLVAGG